LLLDEKSEHFKTMRSDLFWLNFCGDISSLCEHFKASNESKSKFYLKVDPGIHLFNANQWGACGMRGISF
jgi:hypothetical protein